MGALPIAGPITLTAMILVARDWRAMAEHRAGGRLTRGGWLVMAVVTVACGIYLWQTLSCPRGIDHGEHTEDPDRRPSLACGYLIEMYGTRPPPNGAMKVVRLSFPTRTRTVLWSMWLGW